MASPELVLGNDVPKMMVMRDMTKVVYIAAPAALRNIWFYHATSPGYTVALKLPQGFAKWLLSTLMWVPTLPVTRSKDAQINAQTARRLKWFLLNTFSR